MHGGRELVAPVVEARLDRERMTGAINEIAGRAKRQIGEWTGDKNAQVEGLAQEMRGKAQQAWAGVKDALRRMQAESLQTESLRVENSAHHADPDASFLAAFKSQNEAERRVTDPSASFLAAFRSHNSTEQR